jgi:hypothetical protein
MPSWLGGKKDICEYYRGFNAIRRVVIFLIFLNSVSPLLLGQNVNIDNELRRIVMEFRQAEVSVPYPGKIAMETLSRNVSISSVRDKIVIISISPLTIDWFIAARYNYTILQREDTKGIITASSVKMVMDWQSYPTYLQYDSIMRSFPKQYPLLCHLDSIGTSINGRKVFALKISDNAATDEDEPEVFYTSSMHGDEIGGYVLMLRLADYLLKNYSLNSRVKNLVDNLEIYINPLANPDGTYTSGNTITYPTRANANGYDLNRNFPDPIDPSIVPQKENVDMMKFLRKHRFTMSANFHAGSEVVNYPWDKWSRLHADDSWFYNISRNYADTVHAQSGTGYMIDQNNGITNGYAWYWISGGRQDFVTWELQGREVTIELDYTKQTPAAQLELLWLYNWKSLIGYLENALYGIHGLVKDSHTSAPVPAKVFITAHDKDRSEAYCDSVSGRFIRLLSPGLWNLTFSANGYRDTTINNVSVVAGQRTDLLVEMKSITSGIDTTDPQVPLLYPNPASAYIFAKLPERLDGKINITIISQAGVKVSDYNRDFVSGYPIQIDVRNLSAGGYIIIFKNILSGVSSRSRFVVSGRFL